VRQLKLRLLNTANYFVSVQRRVTLIDAATAGDRLSMSTTAAATAATAATTNRSGGGSGSGGSGRGGDDDMRAFINAGDPAGGNAAKGDFLSATTKTTKTTTTTTKAAAALTALYCQDTYVRGGGDSDDGIVVRDGVFDAPIVYDAAIRRSVALEEEVCSAIVSHVTPLRVDLLVVLLLFRCLVQRHVTLSYCA
jgi:hypothetical protein